MKALLLISAVQPHVPGAPEHRAVNAEKLPFCLLNTKVFLGEGGWEIRGIQLQSALFPC